MIQSGDLKSKWLTLAGKYSDSHKTDELYQKLETKARENIRRELGMMETIVG